MMTREEIQCEKKVKSRGGERFLEHSEKSNEAVEVSGDCEGCAESLTLVSGLVGAGVLVAFGNVEG